MTLKQKDPTPTLPRIALVYGRGIEGCGVTRWGAELQEFVKARGGICDVFAYGRKKFLRGDAQAIDYTTFSAANAPEVRKKLDEYDFVFYTSIPVAKTPVVDLDAFYSLVHGVTKPIKCFFSFENTIALLKKTPYLPLVLNDVDQIYGLQCREDSWLRRQCELLDKPLYPIKNWMDFDKFLGWMGPRQDELLYIGRNAAFKNLPLTLKLGRAFQRLRPDYAVTFRGVEAGYATVFWLKKEEGVTYHYDEKGNKFGEGPIHFWNSYEYEEGMRAMGTARFGVSLCHIEPVGGEGINHMEYAMMEMIALGAAPLFHARWLETTTLETGERYIDAQLEKPFCIPVGADVPAAARVALSLKTPILDKYLDRGFQLIRSEYEAGTHIPRQLALIRARGKATPKWLDDTDVLTALSQNGKYAQFAASRLEALHRYGDLERQRVCVISTTNKMLTVAERRDFR